MRAQDDANPIGGSSWSVVTAISYANGIRTVEMAQQFRLGSHCMLHSCMLHCCMLPVACCPLGLQTDMPHGQ